MCSYTKYSYLNHLKDSCLTRFIFFLCNICQLAIHEKCGQRPFGIGWRTLVFVCLDLEITLFLRLIYRHGDRKKSSQYRVNTVDDQRLHLFYGPQTILTTAECNWANSKLCSPRDIERGLCPQFSGIVQSLSKVH